MAAAMANGGDGDSRVSSGKGVRGGREGAASEGEVRGGRGGAWRHRGVEEEAGGGQGKQEVAEASRARATPRLCLLAEEDDRGGVEMGWAVLGQVSGRQVTSFSLSLLFLFYFCYFVFDLI